MKELILRFGWVRSIAAALTAAGVAVVFVVLIVPTAFGSSKGGCGISIKKISTDKAFLGPDVDENIGNEGQEHVVAIFGSKLQNVDLVYFGGPSGKEWIEGTGTFADEGGGYYLASPEPESIGVPGRIKVVDTGQPNCYAISGGQFTPKNAGTDS